MIWHLVINKQCQFFTRLKVPECQPCSKTILVDGDRKKTLRLPAETFLSRFLSHVLPAQFRRVRHYGLLANRDKQQRIDHCRRLLGVIPRSSQDEPTPTLGEWVLSTLDIDINRCPDCGGPLTCETIEPHRLLGSCASSGPRYADLVSRSRPIWDTS